MSVIRRGEREWRIEDSAEGIPLVFGDGKYPQDPPRVASALESALAEQLQGAVDLAARYGDAITAISAALPDVNRARAIIAALDTGGRF